MVYDGDHWNGHTRQSNVPSLVYPVSVTNKGIHWCKKLGPAKDGDIVRDEAGNEGYTNWEIDRVARDVELMQYVGLKDKNGREIYESDIIRVPDYARNFTTSVEYSEFYVGFKPFAEISRTMYDSIEVIGNIYENPALLQSS
ncbi:YopX family protein [Nocardia sp. NPDC050697]|uniref:YopX family protein n=1 Tax=Nocardia sp. NPDC050697 TaxID=3155158 RepID=UPI0033CFE0AD